MPPTRTPRIDRVTRRAFCTGVAAVGVAASTAEPSPTPASQGTEGVPPDDYRIQHGRIRHSVMGWCFDPLPTAELIAACHRMGMTAMEGIGKRPVGRVENPKPLATYDPNHPYIVAAYDTPDTNVMGG